MQIHGQKTSAVSMALLLFMSMALAVVALSSIPAPLLAKPHAASGNGTAQGAPQAAQQVSPPLAKQTAARVYKNIQVLKDIPADQLVPAMQYITVALGVECSFCHVSHEPAKDDKPEKLAARKMMLMMFAIDKDHFEGHQEVTC